MAINPFVELARAPVETLAWLGYLFAMLGIVILAVPWSVRKTVWLIDRYRANRMSSDWWSFGESNKGYIPPAGWLAWAFAVCIVIAGALWALGSVVWLLGV